MKYMSILFPKSDIEVRKTSKGVEIKGDNKK